MESMGIEHLYSFYKGKKVFVTGCTGFKGSWLCLFLKQLDAKVTGYSLEPETQNHSLFKLLELDKDITYIAGDIRDLHNLSSALQSKEHEIIFHLAAQSLVHESYITPVITYETNVIGTVNVLEAARRLSSIKAVLNVTTDKCYENTDSIWPFRENDTLGGFDPYSCSKACSEMVTNSYRQSFYKSSNIGLASARAGNVIGGGDFSKNRIIPDIVRAILNNDAIILRNPFAIRPWQHVLDVLNGYLMLAKKLYEDRDNFAQAFNFGPLESKYFTVQELTTALLANMEAKNVPISIQSHDFHESKILMLDSSKAVTNLKWRPKYGAKVAVNKTATWYNNFLQKSDIKKITQDQVSEFVELN